MDSDRARWRDVRWQRRRTGASAQKSARCKRLGKSAGCAKRGDGDDRRNRRALGICQLALKNRAGDGNRTRVFSLGS